MPIAHEARNGFVTDGGVEVRAVTAIQMRELDRVAIEQTGPELLQMMENAGRSLAELAIELLGPTWRQALVIVLAGGGGNGGGGICAARHLANHGARVALVIADPAGTGDAAGVQRRIFGSTSGSGITAGELPHSSPELILDALIGYGLRGAPHGAAADLIEWANESKAPILALDVPSGIDATTGAAPGVSIQPRWTMTLALPKTGLLPHRTGSLFLADIGIPERAYREIGVPVRPPFGGRFLIRLTYRALGSRKAPGFSTAMLLGTLLTLWCNAGFASKTISWMKKVILVRHVTETLRRFMHALREVFVGLTRPSPGG